MRFPTLYHKGKNGEIYRWTIWAEGNKIITEHGHLGGVMQYSQRTAEGKNIGRSNETTPEEQAVKEARSMWINKVERKYSETVEAAQEEVFLPMLAHSFKDPKKPGVYSNKVIYPADIQPKLDGVRCMAFWDQGWIYLGTRNGKEWKAPFHIAEELSEYLPTEMVLDGELYIHGVDFESLSSWTKKLYMETAQLEYHVFDMPIDETGNASLRWAQRLEKLREFFHKNARRMQMVKLVDIVGTARTPEEVLQWEEYCVEQGYEGAMIRNRYGLYLFGHRSHDLLKVKSSQDAEYKIVDFTNGVGKFERAVVWICETPDKKTFRVVPKADQKRREYYFANGKKYIGKYLKVRYQNLTKEGIPRFPRAVGFRDPRDM